MGSIWKNGQYYTGSSSEGGSTDIEVTQLQLDALIDSGTVQPDTNYFVTDGKLPEDNRIDEISRDLSKAISKINEIIEKIKTPTLVATLQNTSATIMEYIVTDDGYFNIHADRGNVKVNGSTIYTNSGQTAGKFTDQENNLVKVGDIINYQCGTLTGNSMTLTVYKYENIEPLA